MKKHEVELIVLGVSLGDTEAIFMKIYKDGTICRIGSGGVPNCGVSGITYEGRKDYFSKLIEKIDDELLEKPRSLKSKDIGTSPIKYHIAFFGESNNGETGERANWQKSTGAEVIYNPNRDEKHPIARYIDDIIMYSARLTNEWYFDIVMSCIYELEVVGLNQTLASFSKDLEKDESLRIYLNNIRALSKYGWDIVKIGNNRKYKTREGQIVFSSVNHTKEGVSINIGQKLTRDEADKFFENLEAKDAKFESSDLKEQESNKDKRQDVKKQKTGSSENARAKKKNVNRWWEFWKID